MVEEGERVSFTALTNGACSFGGVVSHLIGRHLRLLASGPLAPGRAVAVETKDGLLLGECEYCASTDGGYDVGVDVEQYLLFQDMVANFSPSAPVYRPPPG